ncbi:chemotaxis protein CheA [uncultured Thiocystis sp.]|jgi:two-component system chemotaxis sensor kinase CheA|uniref:chemotaxis protein CheA n=1 Tax=uncultured Thiocystis sp. TaxID=1202134 RepID=UPI0025EDFF9C|nr:chemotaxis protein CheA [uncultured Thiocystis sp.]
MAIDPQDEILQDFLVEAGELLEALNEQLIDLEQNPEDRDLLNAVFRSFHTIKGGAGFLNLNSMVIICHHAEDVFNLLRNNQRKIEPFLMDTVLRVLDVLNVMFGDLKSGNEPEPAPDQLIEALAKLAVPGEQSRAPAETPESLPPSPAKRPETPAREAIPVPAAPTATSERTPANEEAERANSNASDDITEAEFEALLNIMSGTGQSVADTPAASAPTPESSSSDLITAEEFDALLDQLQGQGATESSTAPAASQPSAPEVLAPRPPVEDRSVSVVDAAAFGEKEDAGASSSAKSPRGTAAGASAETSVRVDTQRLDEIMNLVGELVLVRNRMSMLRTRTMDEELGKAIGALALVTADLQTAVMKTRMQPIKKVFSRFPRVVRDLARSLGKEIDLEIFGEETDLDKNLVEALADPLVHLIRNAVDHGVEMPEVREAHGKSRKGTIVLGAAQEGDHISLIIQDDGRGMDPVVLRRKAVEKGLLEPTMAERLSDRDSFNLIFLAGLSTKDEISDVSGRGVGMDVVKTRIAQLNGTVEIDSEIGRGTKLLVKLPLTLAILPALMVILDGRRFAIPLASVSEILDLDLTRSHFVDDQEAIMVRSHALPLYYIGRWLHPNRLIEPKTEAHVVVVHVAQRKVGLVVDGLVGQEEVVIKPLGRGLQGVPGLAGATITGDGGIALIIDVPELLRLMGRPGYGGRGSRAVRQMAQAGA